MDKLRKELTISLPPFVLLCSTSRFHLSFMGMAKKLDIIRIVLQMMMLFIYPLYYTVININFPIIKLNSLILQILFLKIIEVIPFFILKSLNVRSLLCLQIFTISVKIDKHK